MVDEKVVRELAERFLNAEASRTPITAVTSRIPSFSAEDGYHVQLKALELRKNRGEVVIGKKVGWTSRAVQELMGVDEPAFGHLTSVMVVPDGGVIKVSDFARPLSVEPEIAFVMGEDLSGPGVAVPEVLKAVDGVVPAIEVPTSRMKGGFEIQDAIADNASSGRVVFGGRKVGIGEVDLRYVGMVLEVGGEISATAAGAAVLGNPVHSVCWLANKLSEYGLGLRAGETIISGSLVAPWTVRAGDSVKVTFDRLGSVSVRFTK